MARVLWQLAAFVVIWLVVASLGTAPPLLDALAPLGASDLIAAATLLLAAVVGVLVVQRWLGGPSLGALGARPPRDWPVALALGGLLGPLQFTAVLGVETALGLVQVAPGAPPGGGLLLLALTFLCVAAGEELLMRGVLLVQVARVWGVPAGVVVSSVIFALFHVPNLSGEPSGSLVAALALGVLALLGVLWSLAARLTGSLWLPVAWHASWNFAQALLGFPVSGHPAEGLLRLAPRGPAWVTGGAFGPEGGLVGLLALGLGALALWAYARRRPRGSGWSPSPPTAP
ncbi:MAG TPA: type II CAAX endopeptidase family protein [Chloroflexota bacterium]|nr:type II CAAX endopeptidase family protein [Chloroflexota bacterium]